LWKTLCEALEGLVINGPSLTGGKRLPGNLNFSLPLVEGQAWMSAIPEVAFSSGSACSAADAAPSHVLTALGLTDSMARRSVRFGVGRFNTAEEIQSAGKMLIEAYAKVSGLAG
jgi:cysteine desulfurase